MNSEKEIICSPEAVKWYLKTISNSRKNSE